MNYGRIVEDSFKFSWKYKSLWIFGMFAGHGSNFNFDIGSDYFSEQNFMGLGSFEDAWHLILPFLWAILVLGILFFILHLIFSPALVDAINRIARGGTYKFSDSYSRGIDFFFRKLGLVLLTVAAGFALAIVLILPFFVLSYFGLLISVPLFLVGLFLILVLEGTAERVMVVRDCSIGDAIEEAYILLKGNLGKFVIMVLITIGIAIGVSIVVGMTALMLYFPVNILVKTISENLSAALILGFIVGLPISIVLSGFVGSFFHSMYTLFYFGLVDPSTPYAAVKPTPITPQPTA